MNGRLVLALPLSLVIHAALLAALLTLVPERSLPALFIDLTVASFPAERDPLASLGSRPRVTVSPGSWQTAGGRSASARPPSTRSRASSPPTSARADLGRASEPADAGDAAAPAPPTAVPSPGPSPALAKAAAPEAFERPSAAIAEPGPAPRGPVESSGTTAPRTSSGNGGTPGAGDAGGVAAASGSGWDGADRPGGADGARTAAIMPGGGGSADSPGAEYGGYLASLRRRIAESLRYPPAARRRGLVGTVQLEIVIHASGAIGAASVVASSSHALLDEAALETVKRLPPLPFPAELPPRQLRVRLPVIFSLD